MAVGIDLGTTNSCVAVFLNGHVHVIQNEQGNRTTPSMVAFDETDELVGEEATKVTISNVNTAIFGVKRLMGRWLDHESVMSAMENWPYQIVPEQNRPKIKVEVNGEVRTYYPEELSSKILKKLKKAAEDYLGRPVTKAVVTVPAHFDDNQRHKTKEACALAGLEAISIINEPTAAAIAYAVDKRTTESGDERTVLIYDVGGGTMDVTVLRAQGGTFEMLATDGNSHLAGEDFNQNLFDYLEEQFRREYNLDLRQNPRSVAKLRKACEEIKCSLSFTSKKKIRIESLCNGQDFETVLTRNEFETINEELFKRTIKYVKSALEEAKVDWSEVDDVVLIGGSTKIPKLSELLQEVFPGKELRKNINPDEAVAIGAAIRAASLTNAFLNFNLLLMEVSPISIGTSIQGTIMDVLIKRNTRLPASSSKAYTTLVGNQKCVTIDIYQGERPNIIDNIKLGKVVVDNIRPAPPGIPEIVTNFELDEDGMLHVIAYDRESPENSQELVIAREGLTPEGKESIERAIKESLKHKESDEETKKALVARNELESFCYNAKYFYESEEMKGKIEESKTAHFIDLIDKEIEICLSSEMLSAEEYDKHLNELMKELLETMATHLVIYETMFGKD